MPETMARGKPARLLDMDKLPVQLAKNHTSHWPGDAPAVLCTSPCFSACTPCCMPAARPASALLVPPPTCGRRSARRQRRASDPCLGLCLLGALLGIGGIPTCTRCMRRETAHPCQFTCLINDRSRLDRGRTKRPPSAAAPHLRPRVHHRACGLITVLACKASQRRTRRLLWSGGSLQCSSPRHAISHLACSKCGVHN